MKTLKKQQKSVESNSFAPYKFDVSGQEYTFVTDYGIVYNVYFYNADIIEDLYAYWFGFKIVGEAGTIGRDCRVEPTIVTILRDFFTIHNNAVIFVCSTLDGRASARFRLFQFWFLRNGNGYEKHDLQQYDLYASLIFRTDCPDKLLAKNIIKEMLGIEN